MLSRPFIEFTKISIEQKNPDKKSKSANNTNCNLLSTMMSQTQAQAGPVTKEMYQAVLGELDTAATLLAKLRKELWKTQDEKKKAKTLLAETEEKNKSMEKKIHEDEETMKSLEEETGRLTEVEGKLREDFELMKKVFARNELKAKEYDETLALLRNERDSVTKKLEDSEVRMKDMQKQMGMMMEPKDFMKMLTRQREKINELEERLSERRETENSKREELAPITLNQMASENAIVNKRI